MARSTGPILVTGAVTLANQVVLNGRPFEWRVPVGTAIAAGALALLEKATPDLAAGLAYLALVAVLFVRVDPRAPAPAENLKKWWEKR